MSVAASSWAWEQKLSGSELIVLLYLSDKSGDNGLSWYGRKRISEKCGLSPRSLSRVMESLEKKKIIARYKRFTPAGDQTSNAIVVLFEGRLLEDDLGLIKAEMLYNPLDIGLSSVTTPLVTHDNTPLSPMTTNTSVINNSRTTTTTTTTEKPDFDVFALALISIIREMIEEGGWVSSDQPLPKATWLKAKASTLFDKFPDPRPEDCAVFILKDWTRLMRDSAS